jgi:hypothetical protein
MRKARVSVHAADVKRVLRSYSIDVPASSVDDLDEKALVVRLRKVRSGVLSDGLASLHVQQAGGASYDGV